MVIIYGGSGDTLSFQHTSRFLGPLLRWLFPDLGPAGFSQALFLIRKLGHLTEYFLLMLLAWRALRLTTGHRFWSWHPRPAALALVLAGAYAVSDEFHQKFVQTRQASGIDVLIDISGATLALGLIWLVSRWKRRRDPALGPEEETTASR